MAKDMKKDEDMELEADHAEMRVYELGFHIDPELSQEDTKKAYQSLKDLVSSKGSLIAEGEADKIQLAYTISRMETTGRRDFNASYFGWLAYEADGAGHAAIIEATNANKSVFRFIDLRTTKEAAKHSAEMHEFYRKAPEAQEAAAEEEAADTELDAALAEAGVA